MNSKKLLLSLFISTIIFFSSDSIFRNEINASFNKISSNPILNVGENNNWDSSQVDGSAVLFENSIFKMWFAGNNSAKRQIGFADSENTLSFVKFINNPIIPWNIITTDDIGVEHPTILINPYSNSPHYLMWFNNVYSGFSDFNIFFCSSNDGTSWNNFTPITFNPSNTSWDSRGKGAPTVIFNNIQNIYLLWYVCRGEYESSVRWRIGFATSTDGIDWTKHPKPVLDVDQDWEGYAPEGGLGNPSVLFENEKYHLFYHAAGGIGYAVSADGIQWRKSHNNPILTPGPDLFDSRQIFNPFILKHNGTYYLYYTGIDDDGKWRIGLAKSDSLPEVEIPTPTTTPTPTNTLTPINTPTPTPTPTSTPTPPPILTPTPTPTPTITPTSTPKPFSPIIIVPGLGASWNPQDVFSCKLSSSGKWKLAPYVSLYNRLINTLTKNAHLELDKEVFLYTYDWRQPLDLQGEKLKGYINQILSQKPAETKVRLIGHSLGGLAIRSYITNNPGHKTERAITVGTPHEGTVLAYPLWEKGEVWDDNKLIKITLTQLINYCRFISSNPSSKLKIPQINFRSSREVVQTLVPSIKSLLPIFGYLRQNGNIKLTSTLINQNDWLPTHHFPANFLFASSFTLSGNNIPTLRYLDVKNPSSKDLKEGDWIDGKPIENKKITQGDGTVLVLSSQIDSASNEIIDGNHGEIISSQKAIEKILDFLGMPEVEPAEEIVIPEIISEKALTISVDQSAKLELIDPKNKKIESEENIIISYNPEVGLYRLRITGKKTIKAYLYISQISGEDYQDKMWEVNLRKNKPINYLLIYNPLLSLTPRLIYLGIRP